MVNAGIGAGTIRAMTPIAKSLLIDSCTVTRTTGHTSDGAFGYSDAMTTVGTYACYVQPHGRHGGYEDLDVERIQVQGPVDISFIAGTQILPQDIIIQGSSGASYIVTAAVDNQTSSPLITVNATYVSI